MDLGDHFLRLKSRVKSACHTAPTQLSQSVCPGPPVPMVVETVRRPEPQAGIYLSVETISTVYRLYLPTRWHNGFIFGWNWWNWTRLGWWNITAMNGWMECMVYTH